MSLAKLLTQKIEADGLSLTQAAEKADVSLPSFRSVAAGKAVPNARSIDKYASFLGISVEDVRASAGSRGGAAKGKGKAKGKRGPGRPPGTGKKRGRPPGSGKRGPGRPPGPGKRGPGRPPGTGKKRGRPPGRKAASGGAGAALVAIGQALASAEGLMGDNLAVQVHNLGAKQRDLIQSILATF